MHASWPWRMVCARCSRWVARGPATITSTRWPGHDGGTEGRRDDVPDWGMMEGVMERMMEGGWWVALSMIESAL
jgi:hypothetical protein